MKTRTNPGLQLLCLALTCTFADVTPAEPSSAAIPFAEIGAKATADYQGDALGISATADGARLRCGFQKLEGCATPEGLWLESTAPDGGGRLRLVADAVGRGETPGPAPTGLEPWFACDLWPPDFVAADVSPLYSPDSEVRADSRRLLRSEGALARAGTVEVADKLVRFIRPGVTEEYSVSVDGVRQDFVITERPIGDGDLRVELALSGARAEAMAYGAKLELEGSSRTLAYSRLRATDATGKELKARMEVFASDRLAVRVADADVTYPIRIDPTFSDANWMSMNPSIPGVDRGVRAAVVDGSGSLYIGGDFTVVADVITSRIAKWDGSGWSALGSGMNGAVYAIAVSGSNVYAGGSFTTAGGSTVNCIAKWDGTNWTGLGVGMDNVVAALAVSGGDLYAGGSFTNAGGGPVNRIAKWDGTNWTALGSGMNGYVSSLAVLGSDIYAGGSFSLAGGIPANYIAKWNGTSWSALGPGMNGVVYAVAVSGNDVYAGGGFLTAGGSPAHRIARWNGSSWTELGSEMDGFVAALAVSGGDVYAGGSFIRVGGGAANRIAKWNGTNWTVLGSGMNNSVSALAVSGSDVYAGGSFTTAGESVANGIAKYNGTSWSTLGSALGLGGVSHPAVRALAVSGSNVYAGGTFTTAGGSLANYIAKRDGIGWSTLGSGLDLLTGFPSPTVSALAVSGGDLYAGGTFTTAGGNAANYIAKWDGNAWSALGSGANWLVSALAVSGNEVYAGGSFTTAGGSTANRIARWDGTNWSALGSGMNGVVNALAVSGSDVYAGGSFTTAGGNPANRIAKWDGIGWTPLGSGMNESVFAIAVAGSDVYAGGAFTTAGGSTVGYIAKWDGSNWLALGLGMGGYVSAIAVSGGNVYAAGSFTTAGGSAANRIAKWDGSSWSALGSGVGGTSPSVSALTVLGGDLYAGGDFTTAGGKVSAYIARANLIPQRGVIQNLGVNGGTAALDCLGLPGTAYTVQRATDVLFTTDLTTLLTTNAPANGVFRCTDSSPPSTTAFYRLLKQ